MIRINDLNNMKSAAVSGGYRADARGGGGEGFFFLVACQLFSLILQFFLPKIRGPRPPEHLALVVRKPISANPGFNRPNPQSKFIL